MPLRLYLLLPLAITLASLHALPFLPRPDRLFGVAIPREIRYGNEGRQALRRYELQLLPWTVAAMFGSVWLPLSWAVLWIPAASLMPLTMASWIFCRRRIEVRHFAFPALSTRQARLICTSPASFSHATRNVITRSGSAMRSRIFASRYRRSSSTIGITDSATSRTA